MLSLPPWAVSVAIAAIVSVSVCLLGATLTWFFGRVQRTALGLEMLFEKDAMRVVMFDEPNHSKDMDDRDKWAKYEREVLFPAANAIERFAALVNRRWCHGPAFYSRRLVKRTAGQLIVSLWDDHYMQCFICSRRTVSSSPSTTYQEFEDLVKWLRAKPLK